MPRTITARVALYNRLTRMYVRAVELGRHRLAERLRARAHQLAEVL